MELIAQVEEIVERVRAEFVPDLRLAVFEIEVEVEPEGLTLYGAVSEPTAAEALHHRLALLDTGMEIRDAIRRLPDPKQGRPAHAIVTSAIAPLLSGPMVAETHISQAVLGHRLLVLREHRRWLHCRTEDGYLGWVHQGYLRRCSETDAREWEIGAQGEVGVSLGARVQGESGAVLARLPWGARFLWRDGRALLPDGSAGELEGEWIPLAERSRRFPTTRESLLDTADQWVGAPYLWGGMTPAGVDCSGFVQVLFAMHGIALPRDSDQQALSGEALDPGEDFSALLPGDLLFFAEDPGRISHVALSLGGAHILHSSLGNGGVQRNDVLGPLAYEQELRRLFVCSRRVLPKG